MANTLFAQKLADRNREFTKEKIEDAKRKQQAEIDDTNFFERLGYTAIDIVTELGGGLLKLGEGLVDAGAGIAGGIGGLFGADTQWAEDFIKHDWTQENYYGAFEDELTSKSYINKAPVVKDVVRGIGQALPTIALVVAAPFTGGATLAGVPFTIGATIASAGGTGMEEALNEGAEFEEAFAYGVMQAGIEGAVEFATAGMGKGITSIGKSVGKNIGKSVTKSVGKTIVEEGISEGVEEGLSALLNPLTKTTYKGAEALDAYKDMTFYLDAGQQALVGAVVGGISAGSGAIVNQRHYGGKTNYNIVQSAQEIATLDTKENNLWKNGKLDAKALQEIQNQRQIELENISSQLMAMSEADRVNALEKLKSRNIDISGLFNEDGSINYENTQNWGVSENNTHALENTQNTKRKPLATDNIEAYSPSLRNKVVEFAPTSNPIRENIKTAKNTIMAINPNAKVVVAENLPVGNAFYDPNSKVLYLSNKADSVEIGGHEITHSLEGTKEYKDLKDYVLSQVEGLEEKINQKIELYKNVNVEQKQGENGEAIARYEAETEIVAEEMGKLLSDQASIDRIVRQNKSVASRIIQWIKDAIAKLTKRGIKGEYYNYLRTAEKLYAKAIKTSFGGVSLAQGAFWDMYYELAKEENYSLENSEFENVDTLDNSAVVRYSKSNRKSNYSQYRTTAMIWANETKTKAGDLKVLYNPTTNTFNLLEADGSGDFVILKQNKNYQIVKTVFEELINEQGSNFEFNESVTKFEESVRRSNNLDLWGTENNESGNTADRQTESESKDERIGNTKTNTGNRRYTLNKDIRYALDKDANVKDLVAIHNTTESKLLQTMELGGFPMPSIAIIKNEMSHDNFGDISIIFKADTINPQKSYDNKVYSADAYSPRFPQIAYSFNGKALRDLAEKMNTSVSMLEANDFSEGKSRERIIDSLKYNNNFIKHYVKEFNVKEEIAYKEPSYTNTCFKHEDINKIILKYSFDEIVNSTKAQSDLIDAVEKAKNKQEKEFRKKLIQNSYENFMRKVEDAKQEQYIFDILKEEYNFDKKIAQGEVEKVEDSYQTRQNTIEKLKNDEQFNEYVESIVDKVINKKYLRNNKDYYTNSGNPRSFDALHESYNAENAVRIMKEQGSKNSEGGNIFGYGIGEIRAALSKSYYNIEEMHQDKHRLQATSEESAVLYEECNNELHSIADEISKKIKIDNFLERRDIALNAVFDIIASTKTNEQAKRLIKRDYSFEINDAEILKIRKLAEKVAELPVKYFEAKPERVVNFNEIVKIFVPEGTNKQIIEFFREKGIDVQLYGENTPTRSELVKTLPKDIRFSLQEKELSKGQVKKEQAKGYKTKVYDKQEADRIVNNLLEMIQNDSYYAEIKGKTKTELVDYLWIQLNSKDEGYRGEVALKVADYLIDNAIMQDYYQDYANQDNIHTLDVLREYLHKVDLSAIKGEIKHRFDKDNSPYLIWGARKDARGLPADVIAQELAEEGISISATNEADIFFEMHDLYKHALSEMKNNSKVTSAKDVLGKSEVEKLRQDIAREVLMSYDKYGKKTKFAEYIEKSQKRLKTLRTKFADYRAFEQAQKGLKVTLNSLKKKFDDKAGWKVSQDVKALVGELIKIESYYGNITKTARDNLRQVGKQLETMYGDTENKDLIPFYDVIRELTDPSKENTRFTTEEIIDITNVLKSFKHTLENYNLVSFNGEKVEIDKIAEQGIKELTQAKDLLKGLDKNPLHRLRNHVYANPVDRMAEMGLYRENSVMMQIYRDMLNGDSKRAKFVMEANMLFDDFYKRNKNYNKVLQEQMVINNGYEDITLHKRQALSLYLTSLRPQGRSHIFGVDGYEGIVKLLDNKLSTRGEMKKALDKGVEIKVTEEMLSNIEKQFTQADREYIELVKTFFNENSRKAKQEVDFALYGVSNVEDGDYFPLKVSKDKIYQEIVDNNIFQVVLNFGFNKTVKPNSSNMIVIDGVDNILAEHIRNMSLYAGYALPLSAYNKIMNKQIMSENGTTNNMYGSVGKIDSNFQAYMKKLWLDIQGITTAEKGWFSKLMSRIRWATASSALGLNPKVLLTQTLSLASAQTEFNPKYIVKGMKHFFGEKEKLEIAKYAPLMWERNLVGSSVDVQDIRQVGKEISGKVNKIFAKKTEGLNKLTTTPISWMDSNVIQSLWFAAQYEVAETKGLEFGTEANKVEAGKRLTEVVFKTQQTSDALGRSEWMRSDNELIKFGRMFTGDAIQLAGRLISSINKYHLAKAMIKSGDIELSQQGQELLSSAKTGLAKAGSAFILNQVMLLAIAMAFKWLKGEDDDEEWGEIAKNEAMANMIGLLPFGGDIADLMLGYEPTNMAYTSLTNTFNIITDTGEIIGTFASGGYQDETKLRASIRKSILNGSRLFGIPTQNLESYTKGVVGKISPATKEEYEALFKTKSTQAYLDKVEKALANGDEEYADRIINIMFDSRTGKIKDDKVMEVTRDLIEQGYDVIPRVVNKAITYEGVEYTLTDKQHKQFTKIYSQANESVKKMVNLKSFGRIDDEAKAKAMNFIYNYYYNLAIEDMLGEDLESKTILFAEAIPIEQLAMAISQAQIYTADTDKKGVTISGSRKAKIQAYINSLGLTAVQKYMIMGYLGYTNKYGETQVKSYINRLKLTKSQKEKLFEMSGY